MVQTLLSVFEPFMALGLLTMKHFSTTAISKTFLFLFFESNPGQHLARLLWTPKLKFLSFIWARDLRGSLVTRPEPCAVSGVHLTIHFTLCTLHTAPAVQ